MMSEGTWFETNMHDDDQKIMMTQPLHGLLHLPHPLFLIPYWKSVRAGVNSSAVWMPAFPTISMPDLSTQNIVALSARRKPASSSRPPTWRQEGCKPLSGVALPPEFRAPPPSATRQPRPSRHKYWGAIIPSSSDVLTCIVWVGGERRACW